MRVRLVLLFGAAVAALALASPLGLISPVRPVFKPRLPPMTREDKSALALDADRPLGLPAGVSSILPPQLYETKASSGRSRPSGSSGISRAVDPYRLPEIIVPFAYDVFLAVDVDTFKYGGMVEIFINVLESTNTIVLHAGSNIQFEQNTVTVETYKPASGEVVVDYTVLRVDRDATYETVTITLDKQLEKGKHYSIIFSEFESDILEGLFGFYRSSYVENGQTKWLATTQFESTHARKAFPCFDEPSFKARFDIAIAHDNQYTVRSNMPGTSSIMGFDEGRVSILTTFDTTVPMSTYLLAWVVSEFDHVSNADATFSTWSRKGTISGVGLSQDIGPKSLQQLGDFTGVPFVLPKTDQFAIPDFNAGAMENWGLVTYREEYLVKTDLTDIRIEHYMNIVVCHELAHQWSGNLVTMDWWSHTWLNEGFATFFENLICEAIKPSLKLMDKFVSMHAHVAMDYDLLTVGGPAMSSEVSTPDEIQSKFDTISYKKGGSVIRMFQHILTPDVFQKGLRRYFSANMYANSNPQLLFRALGAEAAAAPVGTVSLPAGVSFATMAESWTEQRGVPVVMVTRDYARNTVTFTQEELRLTEFGAQGRRWYVPVTYVTGDSADFSKTTPMAWLTPDKPSVTVQLSTSSADSWLLANPEGIAYYRVLYDSRNWQQLHAAIKKGVIPAASQSQIIGDALALARVGHLSWVDALQTLDVLVGNKQLDTTVWISAVKTLNLFTDYLANTDIYNAFLTLKHRYTEAAFEAAGLTVQPNDEHDHRYTRYYVAPFACSAGNKKCLKEANDQLKVWLQKPEEIILHADTATATLTYGVMGGDISTFQAVKSLLEQTEDTDVRSQLIKALTFSLDSQLITSLLSEALDSWVVKTDTTDLFSNLINRAQHHRLLFNYLKSNWQKIDLYYGDASSDTSLLLRIVAAWIRTVRSDAEYKEVSEWTEQTLKSRPGYGNYITKALSNVDDTLTGWHRKHYGDVSAYINSITDTPDSSTSAPTDRTTPSPPRTSGNPSTGSTSRIPPQPTGNPVTVTPPPATTPNKAPLAGASSVLLGVATMVSFLVARLQ